MTEQSIAVQRGAAFLDLEAPGWADLELQWVEVITARREASNG